ncbi:MAG: hypothetical protein EOO89_29865 [Pedobacter sp.]|nr:MAG: hypothetical protein EOO89_29865 [Pedobacter sp.]
MIREKAFPAKVDLILNGLTPVKTGNDTNSLAAQIVTDPANTFYYECKDEQMRHFGIGKGALVIIDRSQKIIPGLKVLCTIDGQPLLRHLAEVGRNLYLQINNDWRMGYLVDDKVQILGVATWICTPQVRDTPWK